MFKNGRLPDIEKVNFKYWNFGNPVQESIANHIIVKNQKQLVDKGIKIVDLKNIKTECFALINKFKGKIISKDENQFVADNENAFNCGLFIYVPQNLLLTDPIEIEIKQEDQLDCRIVMCMDSGSSVSMIQTFNGETVGKKGAKIIEEVNVKCDAQFKLNTIQHLSNSATYFKQRIKVEQNANVMWNVEAFNLTNSLNECEIILDGTGAQGDLKIISLANNKQVQGFNAKIINCKLKTIAKILQRGIVMDQARIVFNGIGKIENGAHGANSQQENRLLMLSEKAKGDANPILLIDDNDVQAGHAASIGKVDLKKMYYLMSRGLSKKVAEKLLVKAFLMPTIDQIPEKDIQMLLKKQLERRLENEL